MRGIQLLLVLGNWLGSLVFGWFQILWWLIVPPLTFGAFTFSMTAHGERHLQSSGIPGGRYAKQVFKWDVMLIVWNTLINGVIFGLSWCVRWLVA